MTELNKITLPKYIPGYGLTPSSGPPGGEIFNIQDPYNLDFFGFDVKGLFPVNPPIMEGQKVSYGLTKKRRHRKKAKKTKKAKKSTKKN